MSFGIAQFYLPPDRGDIPDITLSRSCYTVLFVDPRDEMLSWSELVGANILLQDITQFRVSQLGLELWKPTYSLHHTNAKPSCHQNRFIGLSLPYLFNFKILH